MHRLQAPALQFELKSFLLMQHHTGRLLLQARFANSSSETFYHDFVRNIVSKYLGEDSAKEADVHPFQYQSPSQIAALYKVTHCLNFKSFCKSTELCPKSHALACSIHCTKPGCQDSFSSEHVPEDSPTYSWPLWDSM